LIVALVLTAAYVRPAMAQQRPLLTEDPEPIGAGRVSSKAASTTPAIDLSRLRPGGNLLRCRRSASVSISSIAELQIDGGFYDRLTITNRNGRRRCIGIDGHG
jgi:hypothetical protein